MKTDLRNIFIERVTRFNKENERLLTKSRKIAIVRLTFFLASIVLLFVFINDRLLEYALATFIIFLAVFILLVKFHRSVKDRQRFNFFLEKINTNELDIIEHNPSGNPDGAIYDDALHPYASDLDIFGQNSLFQFICRTRSRGGQDVLAEYLKNPASRNEIRQRQDAVSELKDKLDWRQNFQAYTFSIPEEHNPQKLLQWSSDDAYVRKDKLLSKVIYIMPFLSSVAVIGWLFLWPVYVPLFIIAINIYFLRKTKNNIAEIRETVSENLETAKAYVSQLKMIEDDVFSSDKMTFLKEKVSSGERGKASASVEQFSKLSEFLEASQNPWFYMVMNFLFLWDLIQVKRIEDWKLGNKDKIHQWIEAIYEIEALSSLAGFLYVNPDFNFPIISDKQFIFKAKELGHPLIKSEERVYNDFTSEGDGSVKIITGSNMSGKSTFLRTLGVNAVLAFCGGPVCAEECSISVMLVFTSMRTKDSLQENTSSFYAELKRLRQLLELVENNVKVFYMLDEILKGTNSADRHNGAMALVRQLIKSKVAGLVSTHDLELAALEEEDPAHVNNLNFSSDIINDELYFDYKLKEGVCKSFNASLLMKKMGIKME